jgi:hypothetical protein
MAEPTPSLIFVFEVAVEALPLGDLWIGSTEDANPAGWCS